MTNPWAQWLSCNDAQRYQLSRKTGWDAFVTAGPRETLPALSATELAALGEEERADYDECRMVWNANLPIIKTQQMLRAPDVIEQVMASNRRDGYRLRGSVVIDAAPGLGKTTAAQRYARSFHLREYRRHGPTTEEGHQRLPVAWVPLTAGVTLKALNQKILQFYGHPDAVRATSTRLGALAVDCVISCQTRIIVIDDLHFIDFKHRAGVEVSNHLKWLANEMPVTFIFTGVQLAEKRFFDEGMIGEQAVYAQTSRRATRCTMSAFTTSTDAGARAWTDLLAALEQKICLTHAGSRMLTDLAEELFRRTQGHIGSLTNLIDRMCWLAITTGDERITREILDMAVADNAAHLGARRCPRPRPARRLGSVPGGYDITRLPVVMLPDTGEQTPAWLCRLAYRYALAPKALLRALHIPVTTTSVRRITAHVIANSGVLAAALGVDELRLESDPAGTAPDTGLDRYLTAYSVHSRRQLPGTRFCPACLAENGGVYPMSWRSPLHLVCVKHGCTLAAACPSCGYPPWASGAWLTRGQPPWMCAERHQGAPCASTRRRWGSADLREINTETVGPGVVAAQAALLDAAHAAISTPQQPRRVCGVPTTTGHLLDAWLELIDEHENSAPPAYDLNTDPRLLWSALEAAHQVLREPNPQSASRTAAERGLLGGGPRYPLGPGNNLGRHRRNPLLAEIRLRPVAEELTPAAQLMFRAGSGALRYPQGGILCEQRAVTRPDQSQLRWIPQQLWPGVLQNYLAADDPAARAAGAMFLAKVGSTRSWRYIAIDLDLPASFAAEPQKLYRRLHRDGRWPAFLTDLDALVDQLEATPPPIDYQGRRQLAQDDLFLTAAIRPCHLAARKLHSPTVTDSLLKRMFWEHFTGGTLCYAPATLRLRTPELYQQYRQQAAKVLDRVTPTLLAAHRLITQHAYAPDQGPLWWRPP